MHVRDAGWNPVTDLLLIRGKHTPCFWIICSAIELSESEKMSKQNKGYAHHNVFQLRCIYLKNCFAHSNCDEQSESQDDVDHQNKNHSRQQPIGLYRDNAQKVTCKSIVGDKKASHEPKTITSGANNEVKTAQKQKK